MTHTATPTVQQNGSLKKARQPEGRYYRPQVDIVEYDHEFVLLADVPGAKGEDVDLNFEDGTLTLHAKIESRKPSDAQSLLVEYDYADFYRTFRVGEEVDAANITADFKDGVLTVHLPKVPTRQPHKIDVRVN